MMEGIMDRWWADGLVRYRWKVDDEWMLASWMHDK